EIDDVLGTAIEFCMSLLPAEALGLGHGNPLQADLLERFLHLVEFEWLDDGFDLFHWTSPGTSIPRTRALGGSAAARTVPLRDIRTRPRFARERRAVVGTGWRG